MNSATILRGIALAACAVSCAPGQFSVSLLKDGVETTVPAVLDFGTVYPAETASARFRIRNTSAAAAPVDALMVRGPGFTVNGLPVLPFGLAPQQALDFSVAFQAQTPWSYSAVLDAEGNSVLLTATVAPALTISALSGSTPHILGSALTDFGSVQLGSTAALHFTIANLTGFVLQAPGIAVDGDGFALMGAAPGGAVFQPGETAGFDVVFQPAAVGAASGALVVGERRYALTGAGLPIPLPRPMLTVALPQARSGQQGTVSAAYDAAALSAGTGTLALDFQPLSSGATDPAIQLGVMGRWLTFPIAIGDTQAAFGDLSAVAFQTGTTAGTLTFTATLGGAADQKTVVIPAAPVTITAASATRSTGSIEIDISGYDNTRSAATVVYTFYDAAGAAITPGISVDDSREFAEYFAGSTVGGNFVLRAVFPVSGSAARIAAFEATVGNTAGTAGTGSVKF